MGIRPCRHGAHSPESDLAAKRLAPGKPMECFEKKHMKVWFGYLLMKLGDALSDFFFERFDFPGQA